MGEATGAAAEWMSPDDLVPWDRNPRQNDAAVDEVAKSIQRFGFATPIVARRSDLRVIAGHTRLRAAKRLEMDRVPVRLLDVSEAEADALALADNKLGEIADWDDEALGKILADLAQQGTDLDGLGWDADDLDALIGELDPDDTNPNYTWKVKSPVYVPTQTEAPPVATLYNPEKAVALADDIRAADLPDDVREFLLAAAQRHTAFDYQQIAEFYAHASAEVQDLMERSALVIIDYNKAIEHGFVKLTTDLAELTVVTE